MRVSGITLSILLTLTLIMGAPLHSFVPHAHAHDASGGEAYVWQSLHASLHHTDKKSLPLADALVVLSAALIAGAAACFPRTRFVVDSFTDSLKRGILPHRKFG